MYTSKTRHLEMQVTAHDPANVTAVRLLYGEKYYNIIDLTNTILAVLFALTTKIYRIKLSCNHTMNLL